MDWLNYHHLFYFWMITREGGLARAAARLRLSHSTLSTQLKALEDFLGSPLFERRGRRLVLTPFGAEIAEQASEIFRRGADVVELARGGHAGKSAILRLGVVHAVPKTLTYRLLEPAVDSYGAVRVDVRQNELERLLEELAAFRLHMVLSDTPPPQITGLRVHAHLLGETEVLLYGSKELAARYSRGFPQSLDDAPLLLPGRAASLRRSIELWLVEHGLRARIQGEIDDAALLRVFGAAGRGLFPVRAALRAEVEETLGAVFVGKLDGLHERYYAVSAERRVRHPAVAALIESARARLAAMEVVH